MCYYICREKLITGLFHNKEDVIMIATGFVRCMDDLGRITIPREIRRQVFGKIDVAGTEMEIFYDKDGTIILKPYKKDSMPDMRDKVEEYIGDLEAEIDRLKDFLEEHMNDEVCKATAIESRMKTLQEVVNDLESRLEERI